jgi:hypothetical protein
MDGKQPPKKIWDDMGALIRWRQDNFRETYDKSRSWARGFITGGRKSKL